MPIAFRHHLRLPSRLWLLGKTLAVMEGMGLQLDPDFDIFCRQPVLRGQIPLADGLAPDLGKLDFLAHHPRLRNGQCPGAMVTPLHLAFGTTIQDRVEQPSKAIRLLLRYMCSRRIAYCDKCRSTLWCTPAEMFNWLER